MNKRLATNLIVLHCTATQPNINTGVKQIKDYHVNVKGWSDVGYHFVIKIDGKIEIGREESLVGAHAENYNAKSIGISLVGGIDKSGKPEDNFTQAQFESLSHLLSDLLEKYSDVVRICGHNQLPNVAKACPVYDVNKFLTENCLEQYIK